MNSNQAQGHDFRFKGKIKDYEKTLIKFFIDIGKNKDAPSKVQEILGYLMIHNKLTQSNLKELTGYSTGTISSTLSNLVMLGVVKKERIAMSNKYQYLLTGNLPQIIERTSEVSSEHFTIISKFLDDKLNELDEFRNKEGYINLHTQINVLLGGFNKVLKIAYSMSETFSEE